MLRVNFGCGPFDAHPGWLNYDASPTLRLQRLPVVGHAMKRISTVTFHPLAIYGDMTKRLPLADHTVDLLYNEHVLEHMSFEDFRKTIAECRRLLRPGGVFRGCMPDLEAVIQQYLFDRSDEACSNLWRTSLMGVEARPKTLMQLLHAYLGNQQHVWIWDYRGLQYELKRAGFVGVRRAHYGDSAVPDFAPVEQRSRWERQLGWECAAP